MLRSELVPRSIQETAGSSSSFPKVNRRDLAAVAVLLVTTIAFFWKMVRPWPAHWYIEAGDFSEQFFPFRWFEAHEWWSGRIPLWNPYMFAGHPFQADIQTAVFYPLAWANAIIMGRHGFPYFALEGEVVVHTFLAGVFMYFAARELIGSQLGAIAAALTFTFSGFITSYPAQQLPILETAVWLPAIVLCLEKAARPRVRWNWLVGAGFIFGIALLAGHTQTALFIAYATGGYLLWRLWQNQTPAREVLGAVVGYPVVAVLLAAVQILPTLQFLRVSTRTNMPYAEAAHGYLLSALWEIFVPFWHNEKALSIGVVALSLAVIGAWVSRREPLLYWTGVGLLAIPLSTGGATFLFWVLYHVAPGWNLFRDQERVIYIFAFAGALLAGRGAAALVRHELKPKHLATFSLGFAAVGTVCVVLGALGPRLGESNPLRLNLTLDAVLFIVLALVMWIMSRRGSWQIPLTTALAALVVVELFAINYGNNLVPVSPDPRPRLANSAAFMRKFPEPFRVRGISEKVFPSNYGALLGLPTIGGNTPFEIRRMRDMLQANADWRVWQILNVKYFLSDGGQLAGLKLVHQDGPLKTYFMLYSLPRAWAVRAIEVAKSPAQAQQMILAPKYNPGDIVVLEKHPSIGPFVPGPRPDVKITHLGPQRIEIDANGNGNAMLVLADQYYSDWHAYRDGKPVPTFRANYLATAVELPPGHHHYVFLYQPTSFYIGAVITLITLLGVLVFWFQWPKWTRERVG